MPLAVKRYLWLGLISCCFSGSFFAQGDDVKLINGRQIDPRRYDEYSGSPYQFADWPRGNIISTNYHRFYDIAINYNGYTGEFEVRNREEYIELDPSGYLRIEVFVETEGEVDTLLFQKGLMPGRPHDFYEIVHLSRDYILLKQLTCLVNERTLSTIGEIVYERKFMPRLHYYLVTNGQSYPVKLRSPKIWALLNRRKEAQEYLNLHDLQGVTEEEWVEVFNYLDDR